MCGMGAYKFGVCAAWVPGVHTRRRVLGMAPLQPRPSRQYFSAFVAAKHPGCLAMLASVANWETIISHRWRHGSVEELQSQLSWHEFVDQSTEYRGACCTCPALAKICSSALFDHARPANHSTSDRGIYAWPPRIKFPPSRPQRRRKKCH